MLEMLVGLKQYNTVTPTHEKRILDLRLGRYVIQIFQKRQSESVLGSHLDQRCRQGT